MSQAVPRRWRMYGLLAGLFATVAVVAAMSLPWFERHDPRSGSETYTPWLWGDPDAASAPEAPFLSVQIAELVFRREWGLSFVIAAAVGALVSFIAAAKRPTDDRMNRAAAANILAAAVALILVAFMAIAFATDGGAGSSTELRIGLVVGVPAVVGWLGYAIAFAVVGASTRRQAAMPGAAPTHTAG